MRGREPLDFGVPRIRSRFQVNFRCLFGFSEETVFRDTLGTGHELIDVKANIYRSAKSEAHLDPASLRRYRF